MESVQLRPRGVGEILGLAFRVTRSRYGDLVKAVAVVAVPVSVLTSVVLLLVTPTEDPFGRLSDPQYAESITSQEQLLAEVDQGAVAQLGASFLLAILLSALAAQLATATTFKIVARSYLGLPQEWTDSVAFAGRKFGPLMWFQLVYGVALTLSFIAILFPGFYFAVAWTVAVPALMFENVRGRGALKRSWELLRGRLWPTFGLLVVVSGVTGIIGSIVTELLMAASPANGDLAEAVAQGLAASVGSVLTAPFAATAVIVLYFDALVRKEGFDQSEMSDALGLGGAIGMDGHGAAGGPFTRPSS